jgi:hypothetical protein
MSNADAVRLSRPHHFPPAIARSPQPPRPTPPTGSVQLQPQLQLQLQLHFNSIFTFTPIRPSLPPMTNSWFSATYYVFLGYNRRRLQSRVQ